MLLNQNKSMFLNILLLLIAFLSKFVSADPQYVNFDVDKNLSLSGFIDVEYESKNLIIGQTHASKTLSFLSNYYDLAKKNDVPRIKELFFDGDGSSVRLGQDLAKNPDMFKGFINLKAVTLGKIYYWGNYLAVDVIWESKDGKKTNWTELLSCESTCFMSNRLYKRDSDFTFFSSYIALTKNLKPNDLKKAKSFNFCPQAIASCVNPLGISVSFDNLGSVFLEKNGRGTLANSDYKDLHLLLTRIWAVEDKLNKMNDFSELSLLAKNVLDCCLTDVVAGSLLPFFSKSSGSQLPKLEYLTSAAVLQVFQKITAVKVISFYRNLNSEFIFAEVTGQGGVKMLQMFHFEIRNDKKLLLAQSENFVLQSLLLYPPFIAALAKDHDI